jgi:two-component system chemotaxis response regulator CheY
MKPDTKFLVVDDYLSMRRMVKRVLNDLGYRNVIEADDGSTALPLLDAGDFKEKLVRILGGAVRTS